MTTPIERARAIALKVAGRHAVAVDAEGRFPEEAILALKDARLLGAFIPRDLGGEGCSVSTIASICYLLGRGCGSTGLIYAMHQIQTACIVLHGSTTEWHRDLLSRQAAEQLLLASATTEAATGGDLGQSHCALVDADDSFLLEKSGSVISYGEQADVILATARRSVEAPPSDQILVVLPRRHFELAKTGHWNTLGMRGTCSDTFILRASGRREQILPSAYGEIQNETMTPFAHLTWASVWLGIAADAVGRARCFLRTRASHAAGALSSRRLNKAVATLQRAKAEVHSALRLYDALLSSPDKSASFNFLISMNNLKLSVSTAAVAIVNEALMICGIAGYRNDSTFSVGRHLRDAYSAALMVSNDRIVTAMSKMLVVANFEADLLPQNFAE